MKSKIKVSLCYNLSLDIDRRDYIYPELPRNVAGDNVAYRLRLKKNSIIQKTLVAKDLGTSLGVQNDTEEAHSISDDEADLSDAIRQHLPSCRTIMRRLDHLDGSAYSSHEDGAIFYLQWARNAFCKALRHKGQRPTRQLFKT